MKDLDCQPGNQTSEGTWTGSATKRAGGGQPRTGGEGLDDDPPNQMVGVSKMTRGSHPASRQ